MLPERGIAPNGAGRVGGFGSGDVLVKTLAAEVDAIRVHRSAQTTKREAVIAQLVNKSAGADLCATKMRIDMMKDVERKAGAEPPPKPKPFDPADEEVIKHAVERIRGGLMQEIQDMKPGTRLWR